MHSESHSLLFPNSLSCALRHVAFLPETPPGRKLSLKACQRQEGTGPAAGTHGTLPGLRACHAAYVSSFFGSCCSNAEDPADARPGESEASLGCSTCGQMAEGCPVQAAGLPCKPALCAVTSVRAKLKKAVCLPRQVLRITHPQSRPWLWMGDTEADRHLLMELNPNMVRFFSEAPLL